MFNVFDKGGETRLKLRRAFLCPHLTLYGGFAPPYGALMCPEPLSALNNGSGEITFFFSCPLSVNNPNTTAMEQKIKLTTRTIHDIAPDEMRRSLPHSRYLSIPTSAPQTTKIINSCCDCATTLDDSPKR